MIIQPVESTQIILLILQALQVGFLWLHDWVPLGSLNDVVAVRKEDSLRRLVIVTLIQSVPWTIGLVYSALYFDQTFPEWLVHWLCISYALLFVGQLRAWWIPYLIKPDRARAVRYGRDVCVRK